MTEMLHFVVIDFEEFRDWKDIDEVGKVNRS